MRNTSYSTGLPCSARAARHPEIVERLNSIVNTALRDPAIADKLLPQGIVPKPMKVPSSKAFVEAERAKFGKIVEQANIKLSN